jgi:acetoacetyl-CoA synthetase
MARITEGALLWEPSDEFKNCSNMGRFVKWLKENRDLNFSDYHELWTWSVTNVEDFWSALWEFFSIKASKPYSRVLSKRSMPGSAWFPGSELNYAEHVFRNMTSAQPALMFQSELRPLGEISWDELYSKVASVAASLRKMGVGPGDRVVAFMPNIPETLIAFLACASIGATWSSCSPDFGTRSVINRFQQIEPKVLFAVNGYGYGGKTFDRLSAIAEIQQALTKLEKTVLVPYLDAGSKTEGLHNVVMWDDLLGGADELVFEQVPFNHPLWVLYSSGTTGLPKGLVHGHGGILIEYFKFLGLQMDIQPSDRFFWYSTTGWVMWNIMQGGLLMGATSLLYDGNPGYPDMDVLWKFAEKTGMTVFGTSAAYLTACMNAGLKPGTDHDLSRLKTIGSTGSPLPLEGFEWAYEKVKKDLWVASVSGGTDPATGFLGSSPLLPVNAGELQCRCLGVKADAFDEQGNSLVEQVGELVITEPMPSMPLHLWNDPENKRYMESYFEMYPGVWRHGDWIKITSRGSAVILGRSDSTLNRLGIRIGSSEIYGVVEEMDEVVNSLIEGFETPGGGYYMPLFVVLKEGMELTGELKSKINKKIRSTLSPRHVPDDIFAIPEVPVTLNGKKLEVPVKKILMGVPTEKAVNIDSMGNPKSIKYFMEFAKRFASQKP